MNMAIKTSDIESILARTALLRSAGASRAERRAAFGDEPDRRAFKTTALDYLASLFNLPEVEYVARETEMRLRVALHLACPSAVHYDRRRPEARWALIQEHLIDNFNFDLDDTEDLARLVASVLDDWDVERGRGIDARRAKLLERQNYRCASCHLDFSDQNRIAEEEERALKGTSDPFKPYFDGDGVRDFMSPEVDHIAAVSKDGTNLSDNLQVLCTLCNRGKGDGSGIGPVRELTYCHLPVEGIPRGHLMALFYNRLTIDKYKCTSCGSLDKELTVRLLRSSGLLALTNLRSICYKCIDGDN